MKPTQSVTLVMVAVRHEGALTDDQAGERVRRGLHEQFGKKIQWATALVPHTPNEATPVYISEDAADFASKASGVDEITCMSVLASRDRFQIGLGIAPSGPGDPSREDLRRRWPVFFRQEHIEERYVDPELERAFIVLDSDVEEQIVQQVLAADTEYMRSLGLVFDFP